ncbi:heavy metal translocating P-type ATPase [Campylobacter majalis]|uniref:heavy metal translocating P-type ATPase n=1 Tax=Campylobacter majalis TaxID=2790656 RepID=UPI003D689B7E
MSKKKCEHCRLSFDENLMLSDDNVKFFCCTGCKNVYEIVHTQGFDEFYSRLGKTTLNPVNSNQNISENIQSLYQNYVKNDNQICKINLIIEGIHCAACIWLNEKVLFATKGILQVDINATNNKAMIVWDDTEIGLAEILARINAIGYRAYAYDAQREDSRLTAKRREFYTKLLVGVFCVMNIMWIAVAQYSGYFMGIDAQTRDILNFAEFILATPVLFYTGSSFFAGYKIAIKSKTPNMDMLIATGATLAYIYSLYAMFSRKGEVYFDSVAMIITFVFAGKFLEILSKKRANDTIDALNSMIISQINIKDQDGIKTKQIDEVRAGDIVVLKAGDKALIDGVIISGEAEFDYSCLNGESLPVELKVGDELKSGSICLDGYVEYEAKAEFKNSLLNKIITMLENANLKKPNIQTLANQLSAKFSITILSIAVVTFCVWAYLDGFEIALITAISVIVIACPCALALATPVSTLVGLSVGLKNSVIFKEARMIESLAKCDTIVFDKTGTLTKGKLFVTHAEIFKPELIDLIKAIANVSNHPVSKAVARYLTNNSNLKLSQVKEIPARGVSGIYNNKQILAGNAKLLMQNEIFTNEKNGVSEYFVAFDKEIIAKFDLSDELRQNAKKVIDEIKNLGYDTHILSGDKADVVRSVAHELEINQFKAEVMPDEKAFYIQNLSSKNVLMVGDGINDTLAMSYASVAVCMGSGADVSLQKSDVVLLNDDLASLLMAIKISKRTLKTIKQNLAFSLCYNALTIPLAVLGYVIPLVAAVSMSLSSIIVILNALRIKKCNFVSKRRN